MTGRLTIGWSAAAICTLLAGCSSGDDSAVEPLAAASDFSDQLVAAVDSSQRTDAYLARDGARNPVATLSFFGLTPTMAVAEIWPTMGWYSEIIAPFVRDQGRYYAVHFPADHSSEFIRGQRESFTFKMQASPELYGEVEITALAKGNYDIAPRGSLDMVLTFRNVHNWTMGDYASEVFAAMFDALKPGGVLGVVEHRGEPNLPGIERATGYMREQDVIDLAAAAGFVLRARSDINANPADTKDHPAGVWTLPPSLRLGPQDYERYLAIGESDRMTLRFRKPE